MTSQAGKIVNYKKKEEPRIVRDTTLKQGEFDSDRKLSEKFLVRIFLDVGDLICLVDSASDSSLINEKAVHRLELSKSIYSVRPIRIHGAIGGGVIPSEHVVNLDFRFADSKEDYKHTFRIIDDKGMLGYDAVLGVDLLRPNRAVIDLHNKALLLWGHRVAKLMVAPTGLNSSYLTVSSDINIPVVHDTTYATAGTLVNDIYLRPWVYGNCIGQGQNYQSTTLLTCSNDELIAADSPELSSYPCRLEREAHVSSAEQSTVKSDNKVLNDINSNSSGSAKSRVHLSALCKEFLDILDKGEMDHSPIKNFKNQVQLMDYTPIKRKQYQVPRELREDFKRKINEYLSEGIIAKSSSPWNLPMIVKRKKTGDIRLILDASSINSITEKMDYPIIRVDEVFDGLSKFQWFSNIDLLNGYHQVELDESSRRFFAFRTPFGKFEFCQMPMGATNSSLFFQQMMEQVLGHLDTTNVVIYQDDILVATCDEVTHLDLLANIFKAFRKHNIRINTAKSSFLTKSVAFLGHNVSDGSFKPSEDNITAINAFQRPDSKTKLRSFIGKVNFFSRFIPGLSHLLSPLTDMLSGNSSKIKWNIKAEDSFLKVKELLAKRPVLHFPNFGEKFIITISTSRTAIAGVLEQGSGDHRWPIGYWSKKLSNAQQNYSHAELGALSIVSVLEHFHHIIWGHSVDVYTDRKAVEYLRGLVHGSSRTADWLEKAAKYAPNYKYDKKNSAITNILEMNDTEDKERSQNCEQTDSTRHVVYTDGSCVDNGKDTARAGIGVFWEGNILPEFSGPCTGSQTNNRAEIQAIIKALQMAKENRLSKIKILTDSKYCIENILTYFPTWDHEGLKSCNGRPIENYMGFKEIYELSRGIDVEWAHVKGHSGNFGNDRAHILALKGRTGEADIENSTLAIRAIPRVHPINVSIEEVIAAQQNDQEIQNLATQAMSRFPGTGKDQGINMKLGDSGSVWASGIVNLNAHKQVLVDSLYVPTPLRNKVMTNIHQSKWTCHANYSTMCEMLLSQYFWSTFRRDIKNFISSCEVCQKNSVQTKKPIILDFPKEKIPGKKIMVDIIGPILTSYDGHNYILTIIDSCSRYLVLCPLKSIKAEHVLLALERYYIVTHGVPETLITDRGSNFTSVVFEQACKLLHIKHFTTAPYRPACNGMVERANKEVKRKMNIVCENVGEKWVDRLHIVQFAHNNAVHSGLNTTPNKIVFGYNKNFPNWSRYDMVPLKQKELALLSRNCVID